MLYYIPTFGPLCTISDLFSSKFHVLDTQNQLCLACLLVEKALQKGVIAKESPSGIFLYISERVATALLLRCF